MRIKRLKNKTSIAVITTAITALATAANAQFVVSDPGAVAQRTALHVQNQITQQRIAAATQITQLNTTQTLTMLRLPTPGAVAGLASMDAGGTAEAQSDRIEYIPMNLGQTASSTFATQIRTADEGAITLDHTKGLLPSGNPAEEVTNRQMQISANIRGEAFNDLQVYANRYVAAQTMTPRLAAANMKDAIVLNGIVNVEQLRQLNLLGQSISLNTLATSQDSLNEIKQYLLYKEDHEKTASLMSAFRPARRTR